ncbi:alpha/beta hydrolase [Mangrovactinospora gilvigrisea]|uniref:Alpha/beta hydrolase n=1 Tax=Mangrovactinospora gilvigrisea TaxID=1428644 RepID=A0A1J7BHQ5_9ACTN|nr:alpha/beta hydrolase family protein [Mangrovactinospora gilvigrisea]OIV38227.1 alpha/beta hydrolase [Mangrovactinospora gilvigrisea]
MSATTIETFTVRHDGVVLPVSRGGRRGPGPGVVFCPGLGTTQEDLGELIGLLRRDHEVVGFDLRGHGAASAAERYTFDAFLGDFGAVMAAVGLPEPPVLVGHSLGADVVLHHAAAAGPGAVAGLVLVDGANPLPEPFLTGDDLEEFRALAEAAAGGDETGRGPTARQILDLNLEMDEVRSTILDAYRTVEAPVTVVMSTSIAGAAAGVIAEERMDRHNRLWRSGAERLLRERPGIAAHWLDADHRLVLTHAPDIARIVRGATLAAC